MKKLKKILAWMLAVAMLLAAVCIMTACAGDEDAANAPEETEQVQIRGTIPPEKPALVVEGAKAKAGDKRVEVMIHVVNNPGILGMDYDLYYDDSVMTLVDAQSVLELEGCEYTAPAYYKNPTTFLWDFQDANWVADGAFLKLYFDIADDAPAGKYEIKIMYSYGNIMDADLQPVDFGVKNGNISIS